MQNVTLRVPEDLVESLEEEADEYDRSRSEHIRTILQSRHEADELRSEIEVIREERDRLSNECEDLRRQLAAANQRIDASNELVRAVQRNQTLDERRARAGVLRRAKWWLLGMNVDDDEGSEE